VLRKGESGIRSKTFGMDEGNAMQLYKRAKHSVEQQVAELLPKATEIHYKGIAMFG